MKVKLSSFVKIGDKINVNIGATERKRAVVLDLINCSDQLIRKKGIIFPIIAISIIKKKSLGEIMNEYLLYINIDKRKIEAIISLKEATEIGFTNSTDILIAINAEPHIALRIINKNKLFENILLNRIYLLFFGVGISTDLTFCIKSSLCPSHKYSA